MERTLYTQEDRRIVEASQRLCQQLDLKLKPGRVSWVRVPSIRLYSSDYCAFDNSRIFVPLTLRGRLDASEWTALIAPALIAPALIFQTDSRMRWKNRLASLSFIPYILGTLPLGTFIGLRVLGLHSGSLAATVYGFVFLSLFLLFFVFIAKGSASFTRKFWLSADRRTVSYLGRERLLGVLKKIDAMKLADIEALKKRDTSVWKVRRKMPGDPVSHSA